MTRTSRSSTLLVAASLLSALALAACGGGAGGAGGATAIPTSTPIPTYGIALPTSMLVVGTREATAEATAAADVTAEATTEATAEATAAAAVASTTGLDPAIVERGKGRYDALTCASCHGADGTGTDDGPSLAALTQTEGEFMSFMRSGGSLGTAHQYPSNKLSDTGAKALYQYLLSLNAGS